MGKNIILNIIPAAFICFAMGFAICGFIIPFPETVITNALNNGMSGLMSGIMTAIAITIIQTKRLSKK